MSLIEQIVNQVRGTERIKVVQPAQVGNTSRRNELLMFAKPEIFMVDNPDHTRESLEMIFRKLNEFEAEVDGVIIVGGRALEDAEIMNRHYGFINTMSRTASEAVTPEDRQTIEELLGVSLDEYRLMGGHEFLRAHSGYKPSSLDELWASKKSKKVRGGFYVQAYEPDGEKVVLVNAFHPVQLEHFTEPSHRIVLLLLHSDTDWRRLRGDLIGATDPEKAGRGSIRGMLHGNPRRYGFEQVGMGNNGVHLSAGPYEGFFEIVNFLGNLLNFDAADQPPVMLRRLREAGLSMEQALETLNNPTVTREGSTTDLFSATEDMNTADAVDLYVRNVRGSA